jgi:hypothetical protein
VEPYNLKEWTTGKGRLFTCGRPGRGTYGKKRRPVSEETIDRWVDRLPTGEHLHLLSLLGQKQDGYSEFSYYPFRSAYEGDPRPSFQEWLDRHYGARFKVHEFPTTDFKSIPPLTLIEAKERILSLLNREATVIVVDSAGSVRSSKVCTACGAAVTGQTKGRHG